MPLVQLCLLAGNYGSQALSSVLRHWLEQTADDLGPQVSGRHFKGGSAIHGARLSPSGQEGSEEPARVW